MKQQPRKENEHDPNRSPVSFGGTTFIFNSERNIYEPLTQRENHDGKKSSYEISPVFPIGVKIRRDFFDVAAWLVALATFVVVATYTYYARGQWEEMRRAANASMEASQTAACALDENRRQFRDTLVQMQGQTDAQKGSASASWAAAEAMKGQVKAAVTGNGLIQQATEAQTRPWVLIDGDPTDAAAIGEFEFTFKITLRNFGQSPAIVPNDPVFDLVNRYNARLPKQQLFDEFNTCAKADKALGDKLTPSNFLTVVAPGKDGSVFQTIHASVARPDNMGASIPFAGVEFMLGCIAYRGPRGDTYHTRVIYEVSTHVFNEPTRRKEVAINRRTFYDMQ